MMRGMLTLLERELHAITGRQVTDIDVTKATSRHVYRTRNPNGIRHPSDTNGSQISAEVM